MKLTIIRDIGQVQVDGIGYEGLDMSSVPQDVHALQWSDSKGEIEYIDGKPNKEISELPEWANSAKAAKDSRDAEVAAKQLALEEYANSPEGKAEGVREMRNALIAETDWWASSDITMTEEQEAYRQALRDITSQAGFPENIDWPTKP